MKPNSASTKSILTGAAFLMATSAIGPGFLTQTTVFTQSLKASFGFVVLVSVLLDLGAQLNIWRIIALHEKKYLKLPMVFCPVLEPSWQCWWSWVDWLST